MTEIEQLKADLALARAERDAADQVALTARRYVQAMETRLNEALDLLRPLAALGPVVDHFDHPNDRAICHFRILGEYRRGPTAKDCRAAKEFVDFVEANR